MKKPSRKPYFFVRNWCDGLCFVRIDSQGSVWNGRDWERAEFSSFWKALKAIRQILRVNQETKVPLLVVRVNPAARPRYRQRVLATVARDDCQVVKVSVEIATFAGNFNWRGL